MKLDLSDPMLDVPRRLAFVIGAAERKLGLKGGERRPLQERLTRILRTAQSGGLDPVSYTICWQLYQTPVPGV